MVAVHVRNLSATQLSPGYQPLISPTYMQNIRQIKIADTVNIYVKLTALQNL